MQAPPSSLILRIDKDEKAASMKFPKHFRWTEGGKVFVTPLTTVVEKLPTGDYALAGYEKYSLLERKGRASELVTNLFNRRDSLREMRKWRRLRDECQVPILYLDIPLGELREPGPYSKDPENMLDELFRRSLEYGLRLVVYPRPTTLGGARHSGEFALRYLWATVRHCMSHCMSH